MSCFKGTYQLRLRERYLIITNRFLKRKKSRDSKALIRDLLTFRRQLVTAGIVFSDSDQL